MMTWASYPEKRRDAERYAAKGRKTLPYNYELRKEFREMITTDLRKSNPSISDHAIEMAVRHELRGLGL